MKKPATLKMLFDRKMKKYQKDLWKEITQDASFDAREHGMTTNKMLKKVYLPQFKKSLKHDMGRFNKLLSKGDFSFSNIENILGLTYAIKLISKRRSS